MAETLFMLFVLPLLVVTSAIFAVALLGMRRKPYAETHHHDARLCAYCNPDNLVFYRPADINALREQLTAQQAALEDAAQKQRELVATFGRELEVYRDSSVTSLREVHDDLDKAEAALETLTRERDEAQRALEETANALAAMTSSAEVADAARRSWKDRAEAAERERDAIEAKWLRVNDMISEVFLTLTAKIATDRSPEAYAAAKDVIRAVLKVAAPGIALEDLIGPMVEEKPCPHVTRTPVFGWHHYRSQCVQCGEKLELEPTRTWD